MNRADLRALTPETLAALANRGLVKRAEKDLTAGSGPTVSTTDDGTVRGTFPDGTETELAPGVGLDEAKCGCGAAGICRHRIGLVLAYRRTAVGAPEEHRATADVPGPGTAPEAPDRDTDGSTPDHRTDADAPDSSERARDTLTNPVERAGDSATTPVEPGTERGFVDWSPGDFDDDALTAALGRPALTSARRLRDRGYTARLHRPDPQDPVPRVELPTCSVSFPVPRELGYALTDAAGPLRGEVVALAVWAFRAGDTGRTTEVAVGGRTAAADGPDDALRTALALADELLLDGVQQAGPVFAGSLQRAREALTATSRHWPAGAVAELQEQVGAYAARGTHYDPRLLASLLAELHARHRAARRDPAGVLGTKEAPVTPLRRVRLVALGCRIGGTAGDRTAETYFAHADAGIVLVLRKRWELTEGQEPTGHELSTRRLLGSPLLGLATANVVSEHTSRAADRTVAISRGRIAATSVTPVGSAWTELPGTLLLRDVAAHLRAAGDRPPRLVRPRVEAESVRVVAVSTVDSVGYDPAAQRLEAIVHDPAGNEILIRADYNPLCPGGLDALAAALGEDEVRCVSGMLNRADGRIVLDPLAVLTATGMVVPDLAPGTGDATLDTAPLRPADPITAALESALTALADAAHHGLSRLTGANRTRLTDGAAELRRTGLHTAARLLTDLHTTLHRDGATTAVPAWVDAQIHLSVTLELHQEGATTPTEMPGTGTGP
ncbi:hypothetical protein [Streptomyces sp. NPDC054794]